jgi:hypothetical protein
MMQGAMPGNMPLPADQMTSNKPGSPYYPPYRKQAPADLGFKIFRFTLACIIQHSYDSVFFLGIYLKMLFCCRQKYSRCKEKERRWW